MQRSADEHGPMTSGGSTLPGRPIFDTDVFCPHCEYNLRGQTEARCPECGREFDPASFSLKAR